MHKIQMFKLGTSYASLCVLLAMMSCVEVKQDLASNATSSSSPLLPVRVKPKVIASLPPLLYELNSPNEVQSIAFAPNGSTLAVISTGWLSKSNSKTLSNVSVPKSTLSLWDLQSGKLKQRIIKTCIFTDITFSSDGKTLAATSTKLSVPVIYKIYMWNVSSGQLKRTISYQSGSGHRGLAFSPNNAILAVGGAVNDHWKGQAIMLFDTRTGKQKQVLRGFVWGLITNIAFSPDGYFVASVAEAAETDQGELHIWDVQSGRQLRSFKDTEEPFTNYIHSPIFFLNNRTLICGKRFLNVRNIQSKLIPMIKSSDRTPIGIYQAAKENVLFTEEGKRNLLELWRVDGQNSNRRWKIASPIIQPFDFSASNKLLAVANSKTVEVWQIK